MPATVVHPLTGKLKSASVGWTGLLYAVSYALIPIFGFESSTDPLRTLSPETNFADRNTPTTTQRNHEGSELGTRSCCTRCAPLGT